MTTETDRILTYFDKAAGATRRQKYEDLLHALLNHTEFLFQH